MKNTHFLLFFLLAACAPHDPVPSPSSSLTPIEARLVSVVAEHAYFRGYQAALLGATPYDPTNGFAAVTNEVVRHFDWGKEKRRDERKD